MTPENCPHRTLENTGHAVCQVLRAEYGLPIQHCGVAHEACTACCGETWPGDDPLNSVVSSLAFRADGEALDDRDTNWSLEDSAVLRQRASRGVPLLPRGQYSSIRVASISETQQIRFPLASLTERIPPPLQAPHAPFIAEWAVGVTTSPRREPTITSCLESLKRAGWDRPNIIVDGDASVPDEWHDCVTSKRPNKIGAWPSYYLALTELIMRQPHADAYLVLQDDAFLFEPTLPESLRGYLEESLWPENSPCIVSLYSTAANSATTPGWSWDSYRWLNGAQALIFPPEVVQQLLLDPQILRYRMDAPREGKADIDVLIGEWAESLGLKVWYPLPSLVQHIGNTSTIWTGASLSGLRQSPNFVGDLDTPFNEKQTLDGFDESTFPPSEPVRQKYVSDVRCGYQRMSEQRVVLCGLARNVRNWLPRTIARLERIGSQFADYRVVIYENDSSDSTLACLDAWRHANHRVTILSEQLGTPHFGQVRSLARTERLAEYRNRYLEYIAATWPEYDVAIACDTDLRGGVSYDGIAHTFGQDHWDFVGSNGLLHRAVPTRPPGMTWCHFDSWAFREVEQTLAANGDVINRLVFRRGEPLKRVWSCFGGLGVYRMEALLSARYAGHDCEHVCLHDAMRGNGYDRLFLNPSQILVY